MKKEKTVAINGSVRLFLFALWVLLQPLVSAQTYSTPLPTVNDKDVALLRTNLQAEAKQLITKNMQFTDGEAAAFWPLYDQYAAEVRKVNDVRFGMIKEYARIYKTMTADQADSLTRLLAQSDQTIISLRLQYLPKFEQALPGYESRPVHAVGPAIGQPFQRADRFSTAGDQAIVILATALRPVIGSGTRTPTFPLDLAFVKYKCCIEKV